jgi:hypothetical protein
MKSSTEVPGHLLWPKLQFYSLSTMTAISTLSDQPRERPRVS